MVPISFRSLFLLVLLGSSLFCTQQVQLPVLPIPSTELGGPDRYLAHLSTDKPIYRGGEVVRFRAPVLHCRTHIPYLQNFSGRYEVHDPRGQLLARGEAGSEKGTLFGGWPVPAASAGGEYTLHLFPEGAPPTKRTFSVRAFANPKLETDLQFLRDGYGPGQWVEASLGVVRTNGEVPAQARVMVVARLNGDVLLRRQDRLDDAGLLSIRFRLPEQLVGRGNLSCRIDDGGMVETAVKSLPLLNNDLELSFFPEGGDLIAGLENRVYFQAKAPDGEPVDVAGWVLDEKGRRLAEFETSHEGRGMFQITPEAEHTYHLALKQPTGIDRDFTLPLALKRGAVLNLVDPDGDGDVHFEVAAFRRQVLSLRLSHGGSEVARLDQTVAAKKPTGFRLSVPAELAGVLTATLFNQNGEPIAERLVFRRGERDIQVSLSTDKTDYMPGERVILTVDTRNGEGAPLAAYVGLTVTDQRTLSMVDRRASAPTLPAMVLLENEVMELRDAQVYLDRSNVASAAQLDLLLGTQGWRRFALYDLDTFLDTYGDLGRRVLALWEKPLNEKLKEDAARDVFADREAFEMPEPLRAAMPPAPAEQNEMVALPAVAVAEEMDQVGGFKAEAVMLRDEMRLDARGRRQLVKQVVAREYAHVGHPNQRSRSDFTETVYWNAVLETDRDTGRAEVSFVLSDSITRYRVLADVFTDQGYLGAGVMRFNCSRPFYASHEAPLVATAGDRLKLPVVLVNESSEVLQATCVLKMADQVVGRLTETVPAQGRRRLFFPIEFPSAGSVSFSLEAGANGFEDRQAFMVPVREQGFPMKIAKSGVLQPDQGHEFVVDIPENAQGLTWESRVYTTPQGKLSDALSGLIREPNGCFEQTSSTSYPLVMAQQYFTSHRDTDPKTIASAKEKLERAYAKLTGFECAEKGYEWFGQGLGHEALTAYGLMQFVDMAEVFRVDPEMVARTRRWLLDRRNGEGGFQRNARNLDSFGAAPEHTTNAYIIWALSEAGIKGLATELAWLAKHAEETEDSYVLALAANVATRQGAREAARRLCERLAARQTEAGYVDGAQTSITRSGGESLQLETTALAATAWLADDAFFEQASSANRFIADRCKGGLYGSTQSTILCLRAIIAFDKKTAVPGKAGSLQLTLDGEPVGEPLAFEADTSGTLELPDISAMLTPGRHRIGLRLRGGQPMSFGQMVSYRSDQPNSRESCALRLETRLRDPEVKAGEVTEVEVSLLNRTDEVVASPVAVIGLPGGLNPRHEQLKALVKRGDLAAYEVRDGNVICYWRYLGPAQKRSFVLECVAAAPGRYRGAAGRAYAYYTPENKHWVPAMEVEVTVR